MIFLHPGMAKSATTSLQQLVFARHPEINYLGLPAETEEVRAAIRRICRDDGLYWDEAAVAAILGPRLASKREVSLLSYENFTLYESTDKAVIADRLHALFPEARVFFTIRRQQDVLPAWYLQKCQKYLRSGHFVSFDDWWAIKSKRPHRSILDDLRYGDVIAAYAERFGRENVAVFLYEQLTEDAGVFCRQLATFLGVDATVFEQLLGAGHANPTIPARLLALGPALSYLPRSIAAQISRRMLARGGSRARVQSDPRVTETVRSLVVESNRRLMRDFQLPLERHGYFL